MSGKKKMVSLCESITPSLTAHHMTNYGKNYTINCGPNITHMTDTTNC